MLGLHNCRRISLISCKNIRSLSEASKQSGWSGSDCDKTWTMLIKFGWFGTGRKWLWEISKQNRGHICWFKSSLPLLSHGKNSEADVAPTDLEQFPSDITKNTTFSFGGKRGTVGGGRNKLPAPERGILWRFLAIKRYLMAGLTTGGVQSSNSKTYCITADRKSAADSLRSIVCIMLLSSPNSHTLIHLLVSHRGPTKPYGQVQRFFCRHVPPCWQGGSQWAADAKLGC